MIDDKNIFRPASIVRSADEVLASDGPKRAENLLGASGFFDSWRKVASFPADGLDFPLVVEVTTGEAIFDTTLDKLSVGVLWDDATALAAAAIDLQVPQTGFLTVGERKGNRLEVWASGEDPFGNARILDPRTADQKLAEQQQKLSERSSDAVLDKIVDKIGIIGIVAAVIAGVILFVKLPKAG